MSYSLQRHKQLGLHLTQLYYQVSEMRKIATFRWPKNHTVLNRFTKWHTILKKLVFELDEEVDEIDIYYGHTRGVLEQSKSYIQTVFETYTVEHRTRKLSRAFHTQERNVLQQLMQFDTQVLKECRDLVIDDCMWRNKKIIRAVDNWDTVTGHMYTLLLAS